MAIIDLQQDNLACATPRVRLEIQAGTPTIASFYDTQLFDWVDSAGCYVPNRRVVEKPPNHGCFIRRDRSVHASGLLIPLWPENSGGRVRFVSLETGFRPKPPGKIGTGAAAISANIIWPCMGSATASDAPHGRSSHHSVLVPRGSAGSRRLTKRARFPHENAEASRDVQCRSVASVAMRPDHNLYVLIERH